MKFKGLKQHSSCELLLLMLSWLHEDISKGVAPMHLMDDIINCELSITHSTLPRGKSV